jgi:hypothetical protein
VDHAAARLTWHRGNVQEADISVRFRLEADTQCRQLPLTTSTITLWTLLQAGTVEGGIEDDVVLLRP